MRLPPFDVPTWSLDAPPQTELTFQGKPIVWDECFDDPADPPRRRCYMVTDEVAEAARKAGYDVVSFKRQKPDS